jgi:hypothetical protein
MSANSQLYVVKLEAMKATLDVYVDYGRALDIDPFDTIWENDKLTITMWM